jgi:TolA-binding protein
MGELDAGTEVPAPSPVEVIEAPRSADDATPAPEAPEAVDAEPVEVPPPVDAPPEAAQPQVPASAAPSGPRTDDASFVDLGSLVIDTEPRARDTRMTGRQLEPTGDEQRDFQEMLAQFKKGIDENVDLEDYEAHYDLGIAFKEMGLLDEAVAEFQKALRAPEGRLRTSEALGVSFFEKGQFPVAEAVLRRAVDALAGGDDEKIGLIYWLGRACEQQGKVQEARSMYERAVAVDIRFMDTSERIQRLTTGRT